MLARLILELLALAPALISEIDQAAKEMHSSDSTGKKAVAAAEAASVIASAAAKAVKDATDAKD